MRKDINQISKTLRAKSSLIKDKFHVESIEIFGSYTREEQTLKSDVDILVTFVRTPSLLKFLELENYLTDLIGVKVDLVMKKSLKQRFRNAIINSSVAI